MITHPEKMMFPDDGITKGELAAYYEAVARGFPAWLRRVAVPKKDGVVHHPIVTEGRALVWLANQNCITPHVWTSRAPRLTRPDICVFDLDPAADEPARLRAAALRLRDFLEQLGLRSWVKTSGSR